MFERRGYAPRIEDAEALVTTSETMREGWSGSRAVFQNVALRAQDTISGDGAEVIFVPFLSTSTEWQGTVIATKYDSSGAVVDQYVADVVLYRPDPYSSAWQSVYEVSF